MGMQRKLFVIKKVLLSTSLVMVLLTGGCTEGAPLNAASSVVLKDTEGHWGKAAIDQAVLKGYVDGYEDGTFRPDQPVTRAEFLKMTLTALKMTVPQPAAGQSWYTPYTVAAVSVGIHRWSDFTTGDWNTPISRLEMARIAFRASDPAYQKPEVHTDDAAVLYNSTRRGLIQGLNRGDLAPEKSTTRGQSVTIIERTLKVKAGETLETDKYAVSNAELLFRGTNFETMFGRQSAISLPVTHQISGDIKMTIQQVIGMDGADKESPYYYLIDGGQRADRKSLHDSYILAFKVRYDIDGTNRGSAVITQDYFQMAGWPRVSNPKLFAGFIRKEESGAKEEYLLFARNKTFDIENHDVAYDAPDGSSLVFQSTRQ